MDPLNAEQLALLQEACRAGVLKVKIAGKIRNPEWEARRFKLAETLEAAGWFERLANKDAFASWRAKPAAREAVRRVLGI